MKRLKQVISLVVALCLFSSVFTPNMIAFGLQGIVKLGESEVHVNSIDELYAKFGDAGKHESVTIPTGTTVVVDDELRCPYGYTFTGGTLKRGSAYTGTLIEADQSDKLVINNTTIDGASIAVDACLIKRTSSTSIHGDIELNNVSIINHNSTQYAIAGLINNFSMTNSTIANNTLALDLSKSDMKATIKDSVIENNTNTSYLPPIKTTRDLTLENTRVVNNDAGYHISVGGETTIIGGEISGNNKSDKYAIFLYTNSVRISGGAVITDKIDTRKTYIQGLVNLDACTGGTVFDTDGKYIVTGALDASSSIELGDTTPIGATGTEVSAVEGYVITPEDFKCFKIAGKIGHDGECDGTHAELYTSEELLPILKNYGATDGLDDVAWLAKWGNKILSWCKEHTITWVTDMQGHHQIEERSYYGNKIALQPEPTDPTGNGRKFLGWFTQWNSGEEVTFVEKIVGARNEMYFAHWEEAPPPPPVTNKVSGTVTYGTEAASNATVTMRDGYGYDETVYTDANGQYAFLNVPNSSHDYQIYVSYYADGKLHSKNDTAHVNNANVTKDFNFIRANKYTISGTVTNNGTPVENVSLYLFDGKGYNEEVYTDTNGHYAFAAVVDGNYKISINYNGEYREEEVIVNGNNVIKDFNFIPTYVISGRVTYDGKPIPNVYVSIENEANVNVLSAQTDTNGNYVATHLNNGVYTITVFGGYGPKTATVTVNNDNVIKDFNYEGAEKYKISGIVKYDGLAVKDAEVRIANQDNSIEKTLKTNELGYYELSGLLNNMYTVTAKYMLGYKYERITLTNADVTLNFELKSPTPTGVHKISGKITEVRNGVTKNATGAKVMLWEVGATSEYGKYIGEAIADNNGLYEFNGLGNKEYKMIFIYTGYYDKEIKRTIKDSDIVVDTVFTDDDYNGSEGGGTSGDNKISGKVKADNSPIANTAVKLVYVGPGGACTGTALTDTNGYYEFDKLFSMGIVYNVSTTYQNVTQNKKAGNFVNNLAIVDFNFDTAPILPPAPVLPPIPTPDPTPEITEPEVPEIPEVTPDPIPEIPEPEVPEVLEPEVILPTVPEPVPLLPEVPAVVDVQEQPEVNIPIEEEEIIPEKKEEDAPKKQEVKKEEPEDIVTEKSIMAKFMEVLKKILIVAAFSLLALLGVGLIMLAILAWLRRAKIFNNVNTDEYKEDDWKPVYKTFIKKEDKGIYKIVIPVKVIEGKATDKFELQLNKSFIHKHNGDVVIIRIEDTDLEFSFEVYEKEDLIEFDYSSLAGNKTSEE